MLNFSVSIAQTSNAYDMGWTTEKDLALFIGYNGWKHHYAEVSIGIHTYGGDGHHPFGSGYSLGSEIRVHENVVVAPKISAFMGGGAAGMALKINALYYTDFKLGRAAIRPEIGIGGFGYFTCTYGFNFYLNKNEMLGLNRHVLSLVIPIRLKHLKRTSGLN